ncbi:MAG TPA: type II toxin-antitoxin system RelE/ParE family toxin [Terriglobia bacterium]|nr:type II toxin-antitoxin system RelE/ParE family toxin [Terriglobia bacterium]
MAEVIWTEPALDSLKAIVDYIAEDSLVYAERFAHNVVVAPRILAEYPQSGRVVPE